MLKQCQAIRLLLYLIKCIYRQWKQNAPAYNCSAMPDPESYRCVEQVSGDQFIKTVEKLNQIKVYLHIFMSLARLNSIVTVYCYPIIRSLSGCHLAMPGLSVEQAALARFGYRVLDETGHSRHFTHTLSEPDRQLLNTATGLPVLTVKPESEDNYILAMMGTATIGDIVFDVPEGFEIRHFGTLDSSESALDSVYWLVRGIEDGVIQVPPPEQNEDDKKKAAANEVETENGSDGRRNRIRRWQVNVRRGVVAGNGGNEPPERSDVDDDNSELRRSEREAMRHEDQVQAIRNRLEEIPEDSEVTPATPSDQGSGSRYQQQRDGIHVRISEIREEGAMDEQAIVQLRTADSSAAILDARLAIMRRQLNRLTAQRELMEDRHDLLTSEIRETFGLLLNPENQIVDPQDIHAGQTVQAEQPEEPVDEVDLNPEPDDIGEEEPLATEL